jgi:excisionase family DNA binding protein
MMVMEIKYYGVEDVSSKLHIAKSTVYAYVGKNKIPHIKLGGKLLFPENDLESWLDSMKKSVAIASDQEDKK